MKKIRKRKSWIVLFLSALILAVTTAGGCSRTNQERSLQVGDHLKMGRFEQDEDTSNGSEAIVWTVIGLSEDGAQALLISEQALERRVYQEGYIAANWEDCTLRAWLNDVFLAEAFSAEELKALVPVTIEPEVIDGAGIAAGDATTDRVFLLSIEEAETYFADPKGRICTPTAHALAQGAYSYKDSNACWWWLRTPGSDCNVAARVVGDGSIIASGCVNEELYCVRPAMWVSMEDLPAD